MKLFPILCDASMNQKSKMAAYKKEILICQPVYNLCIRVAPGETIAH